MIPQGSDVTSPTMPATIVHIQIEKGREGLLYATSPELKGLLVAEATEEALAAAIPGAIQDMYEACGVRVVVTPAQIQQENLRPWIATPVSVVKAALAAAQMRKAFD